MKTTGSLRTCGLTLRETRPRSGKRLGRGRRSGNKLGMEPLVKLVLVSLNGLIPASLNRAGPGLTSRELLVSNRANTGKGLGLRDARALREIVCGRRCWNGTASSGVDIVLIASVAVAAALVSIALIVLVSIALIVLTTANSVLTVAAAPSKEPRLSRPRMSPVCKR